MIEQLYFDLAEESNDTIIYGKLFQDCKAAAEELFRADRVNGSLQGSQGADEK